MKQEKLKKLIKDRRIKIHELAAMIGCKPGTLYKKMAGCFDFTYTEVFVICLALGIENPIKVFYPKDEAGAEDKKA